MAANQYEKVGIYGKTQKTQADPSNSRDTDARALLLCASRLNEAKEILKDNPKSKENLKIYGEAIRSNQRLWTIFQIALTDPENPLPMPIKVNLMNVSEYVDKTSFSAIGKFAPKLIDNLININRTIATGLSKQPAGGASAAPVSETFPTPTSLMTSA